MSAGQAQDRKPRACEDTPDETCAARGPAGGREAVGDRGRARAAGGGGASGASAGACGAGPVPWRNPAANPDAEAGGGDALLSGGEDAPPGPAGLRVERRYRPPLVTNVSAARWLLLGIVLASVYFFHGFLVPVLAASVIALASWPLRERCVHRLGLGRTVTAALLVLLLVCFLVVPIAMALVYAFRELRGWVNWAILVNASGAPTPRWMVDLPQIGPWLDLHWREYIGHPGGISEIVQAVSGSNIGTIYRGAITAGSLAFHVALTLLFMLITLFVLYRDGNRIVAQIDRVGTRILPERWDRLSRVVPATISSTVTGMTLIAIGEGVILGIAYWIAGVPSPVTLGVITGFMALIPGGAPLSFTLVSIYLVARGSGLAGLALLIWGTCELFIVDKTLRPTLVGGPVKLPFLPTFFGLIGGVKTLGLVGLFVGPVLMALLVAIWREWQREIAQDEIRGAAPAPDPPP